MQVQNNVVSKFARSFKRLIRADKKFAFALALLLLLAALMPLLNWYVGRIQLQAQALATVASATIPTAVVATPPKPNEPRQPRALSKEEAPDTSAMPALLAATMFTVFYEKQSNLMPHVCEANGVPMSKYSTAITKAYAKAVAAANGILGSKSVYFETYLTMGGREAGITRVEQELDQKAKSLAKSRADICRGYEASPEKAIAETHYSVVQPQSFKILSAAASP